MAVFSRIDDTVTIPAAERPFGCWRAKLLALLLPLTVWAASWGVASGQAEATPTAARNSVRDIPLVVLEGSSYIGPADSAGMRLPLLTLCTLPKASRPAARSLPPLTMPGAPESSTFSPYAGSRPTLEAIGTGKLIPQPRAAEGPLYLVLTAPFLNIRKTWLPTHVTLVDKTLILAVTAMLGSDAFGAAKNFSCRRVCLIALPALPAGDYKLALEVRQLSESSSLPCLYSGSFEDRAITAFTLPATGAATATAAIAEADLSRHAAPALTHRVYQDLLHFARFADPQTPAGPRLDVGKLDAYPTISEFDAATNAHRHPKIPTTAPADPTRDWIWAVVTGPNLDSGQWMTLREVYWVDNACRIAIDLWRDNGPREKNIVRAPFFAILVRLPPPWAKDGKRNEAKAATYTFAIEWHPHIASGMGEPYSEQPLSSAPELKPCQVPLQVK